MKTVTLIIIGAGSRGFAYAEYAAQNSQKAKIIAVAEPREYYRQKMAQDHNISSDMIFSDWREVAKLERFADVVVIATPDNLHTEPAIAFAEKGYHIILEKPMAPTAEECKKIVASALENKVLFAVCHVLRYTKYTQRLKQIIDSGVIGDIVSVQHLEPVGYWHHAHSYVRGNWRNEKISSSMLLAKSCHDLDWLRYVTGQQCKSISSFGSLKHFKKEHKPQGAGQRCLDCDYESQCPYSARKIYVERAMKNDFGWPVNVITQDLTVDGVIEALKTGPYGICVYNCDNDVVDHQVVNMLFENDITATFTMTAFTRQADRKTRIFGTRGELYGDGSTIKVFDFLNDETTTIEVTLSDGNINSGHGGGDYEIMKNFVEALRTEDANVILSGPQETLETHLMVFAAEKARLTQTVVPI